ncbi:uncharacterized protein LOC119111655 [Pollicipes pollicipes]|uniref:uncharacterized protein LOC119111655 n=1 Tax=Pollicipes pollicipes TaxID=41117 RepID=UPI0018857CFF|nr:uncharacterized protein LOC119111655 [Pollicipes pollicipes]
MAGVREVYRAGWLKKITSDDKKKAFKSPRIQKVWLVFCVHDERSPFLEQYDSRQLAAGHQPDFAYPLAECFHVSASIRATLEEEHEFVVTLRQDVVKFSSSRQEVINDWISILRNQLHELKVLESKSNLYSRAPRQLVQFGLQRDPNSPLPPPPPLPVLNTTLLQSAPPRPRAPSPPTATSEDVHSESPSAAPEGGRQLGLREHQVLALRREIAHRPGVRLVLPRRTLSGALALADGFGAVWLCGWRWKEQPTLSCALHVGDRVASVGGVAVTSAAEFSRLVKQQQAPVTELVVQRMPHAMVVSMRRETEGQELGLLRDGGTGEVLQVLPDGLAAGHGLPARSGSADGLSLCNWYITEVNSRAVSLFSKGGELGSRLAAVGRDISLVVQPADLVRLMKRQLKTIRGYKQYVVQ